ncbi:MAG: argininosuccinate synthase [Thermoleophilia bacterium]|nr:argininosuccinate synthase [Thermoleophilia bacterium]
MTEISLDSLPQPVATYEAKPEEVNRVLLLYSGGLDTSVMLHWIQEAYGAEVVTLTINLGQPGEDYAAIIDKAEAMGAAETVVIDAREEFVEDYVLRAIKANALYGGGYPLFTSLGRPLIGKLGVEVAARTGCDTLAHGCTGKGNDQVRLEATVAALNPELKMIAPVRSWQIGRDEELAYCHKHGIPLKYDSTEDAPPYSIDDNLWGRSSEGGTIENLDSPPPDDVFQLVTRPELAPDEPETVSVGFEAGRPVSFNGEPMELVPLLEAAADAACRHGVGIVDHLEDRIVGLKVRDLYEVPAATVILTAHQELEKLVSTIHQNNFKHSLDRHWAYLAYSGLWHEPLRHDLDSYMDSANEYVTGEVSIKLFKGSATPTIRSSPYALYDESLASFGESGGDFSQAASPGFIELFSLQSRMAQQVRNREEK